MVQPVTRVRRTFIKTWFSGKTIDVWLISIYLPQPRAPDIESVYKSSRANCERDELVLFIKVIDVIGVSVWMNHERQEVPSNCQLYSCH